MPWTKTVTAHICVRVLAYGGQNVCIARQRRSRQDSFPFVRSMPRIDRRFGREAHALLTCLGFASARLLLHLGVYPAYAWY